MTTHLAQQDARSDERWWRPPTGQPGLVARFARSHDYRLRSHRRTGPPYEDVLADR
jgi:hypothetical protein